MEAHKAMGDGGCQKRREEGRGIERERQREGERGGQLHGNTRGGPLCLTHD